MADTASTRKKVIIIAVAAVLVLGIAAGILIPLLLRDKQPADNSFFGSVDDAGGLQDMDYDSFTMFEGDPSMKIDGELDEPQWQGKAYFRNTYLSNTSGALPTLRFTAFPTEWGVYIGSEVTDTNIVNDGQRSGKTNTMWVMYIGAFDVDETPSQNQLYSIYTRVDMRADLYGKNPNIDRAVKVEGEINSGATTGATLEMFVPWQVLGVDPSKGIPKEVFIRPTYSARLPGEDTMTEMLFTLNSIRSLLDYVRFDEDGYTQADREGAVLGDNKFGYAKSPNWDVSREAEGVVESSIGEEYHRIYFSREYGDNFLVEATLVPVGSLNNNGPMAGILFENAMGKYHTVFLILGGRNGLVPGKNGTKNFPNYRLDTLNNSTGGWHQVAVSGYDTSRVVPATAKEGTTLTVLKSGENFYYFIDGIYMASERQTFLDGDVFPGFYSLGCDVIYKDYSCKTLDDAGIRSYLKSKGVYTVDVETSGSGGTVVPSKIALRPGENYDLKFTVQTGTQITGLTVNGRSVLADAKANAKSGVYTVRGVTSDQKVKVTFSSVSGATLSGSVTASGKGVPAKVILEGVSDKLLRYEVDTDGSGGYSLALPRGSYNMVVSATGYKGVRSSVTVSGNTKKNFALTPSDFPQSVRAAFGTVNSSLSAWDLTDESSGRVRTSHPAGKAAPLYFSSTAADFVVETTVAYVTEFEPNVQYQPDVLAGFQFSDGKNTGWVVADRTGYGWTGWKFNQGIVDARLTTPDPKPVTFALCKIGNDVCVYIDGNLVGQHVFNDLCPGVGGGRLAVGLYFYADYASDAEYSGYYMKTGSAAAKAYIDAHKPHTVPNASNPLFADNVLVNGKMLNSSLSSWDLSALPSNVASTSYALKGKNAPLYFNGTGNAALLSARIEYTTAFTGAESQYQPDLMGGFILNTGDANGWVWACSHGLCYTGWKYKQDIFPNYNVLHYPDKKAVTLTLALRNGVINVYFNGALGATFSVSNIVAGANSSTQFAFALTMLADKTADVRFSEISASFDPSTVDGFIAAHAVPEKPAIPAGTLGDSDTAYANLLADGALDKSGNSKTLLNSETTVFIGDSFFDVPGGFWTNFYSESFSGKNVFSAAIGGTRADQWVKLVDTIFYRFSSFSPRNIVINLGQNDAASGHTTDRIVSDMKALITKLHEKFPDTNIYYFNVTMRRVMFSSGVDPAAANNTIRDADLALRDWFASAGSYAHYLDIAQVDQWDTSGDGRRWTSDFLKGDNLHPLLTTYKHYVDMLLAAGCDIL